MSIAKKFVDALKTKKGTSPYDTTAEITRIEGNTAWVHIPGGVDETPVKMTISASVGQTVQVRVANGTAFLVGNASAPPTDDYTANIAIDTADEAKEEVTILNTVVTEQIQANNARFGEVEADTAKIHNLTANQLNASVGYIEDLTAASVTAQDISSATGYIGDLTADSITAQDISAATGYIDDLTADHVTASNISAATGYIDSLTSNNVTAQNIIADHGTIGNLNSNYAHITNGVIDNAKIGHADVNGLSANYAQINAANINTAAIRNAWIDKMMVQSGLIAHEGTVYTLDAIKVNASNITAGTIDVERLIVTVDGEKYMVHVNPSTGTPSYEKLDGDIIEDLTITADKIVAGAITAEKITAENIVGSGGWINLRNGTFSYVNATSGDGISWDGTNLTINSASLVSNVTNKFSSQNLLPGVYYREYASRTEYTSNGITWTVNADGSVTATGVATANSTYHCTAYVLDSVPPVITIDPDKRYTLSGCPAGGSTTTYRMYARYTAAGTTPGSSTGNMVYDYGAGHTTSSARKYVAVGCQIMNGYNCGAGVTFYPMLEVGIEKHNYVSSHSAEGALSSSIKQNADNINLRVQKNDVINQINLSTEGATISANRVNIAGATLFTTGRLSESSLDNAYDANGSASTAEANAKAYANSGIKTSVTLYYASNSTTAPAKPTAHVTTNSASTRGAWNIALPTYNASYPYLYTCTENLTIGNTYTWTSVEQSTYAAATAAIKSTADSAAPKSSAVAKTQRIYYRSKVSSKPSGNALISTWVTESGNKWNDNATTASGWSLKKTPIANGTGSDVQKFLYLWCAEQIQLVDGTVIALTQSDIALDDSTTVIDGGKIITGSVTANQIDVTGLINAGSIAVQGDIPTKVSELTNDSGFQDATQVSSAITTGIAGKADKSAAVKSTVSCYYRSTTNSTPSIDSSTTIGTAVNTDNAWEYVMPYPKKNCYFYTCEKYTFADNSVDFSTVRALSNATYTSKWCSSSNASYIDGGAIYANSVTADKLNASDINASGTLTIGALSSGTQDDILNSNIDIGGKNLIQQLNPVDLSATAKRPNINGDVTDGYLYTPSISNTIAVGHGVRYTAPTALRPYISMGRNTAKFMHGLESGETYTISFRWKAKLYSGDTIDGTPVLRLYLRYLVSGETDISYDSKTAHTFRSEDRTDRGADLEGSFEWTFIIPEGIDGFYLTFAPSSTTASYFASGDYLEMTDIKLERGNKATDWSPAPEDVDTAIDDASKTATSYLTTISGTSGISVHDANDTSNFVNMNSSGVNIYRSGSKVAEFGSDITLGKVSDTHTVINSTGYDIINGSSNKIAHFGYDTASDESGSNTYPFYTLGTRLNTGTAFIGGYSMAEGVLVNALGFASHAEGNSTTANGGSSHAEGRSTIATGTDSHAEGSITTANGRASHAEGVNTKANGDYSHAQNGGTIANGAYQTAIGMSNVADSTSALIIGNGTASARSNALTVDWNGNLYAAGDIYTGGADSSTGKRAATIAYATCSTAAGTAAKVATVQGDARFVLQAGAVVGIKFTNTNTAGSPTINVNSTGAKPIQYQGTTPYTSGNWVGGQANYLNFYMYDGTSWVFMTQSQDRNTTYTNMTQAEADAGTVETGRVISAKVLNDKITNMMTSGLVDVNDSVALTNVYAAGFLTGSQKNIQFFVPYALAGSGTYSITSLSIVTRFAEGGYGYIRSGTSGGTYTQLGSSWVSIISNGAAVRSNEISSFEVEVVPHSGFRVVLSATYAIAKASGNTAALTNNTPCTVQVQITVKRTA